MIPCLGGTLALLATKTRQRDNANVATVSSASRSNQIGGASRGATLNASVCRARDWPGPPHGDERQPLFPAIRECPNSVPHLLASGLDQLAHLASSSASALTIFPGDAPLASIKTETGSWIIGLAPNTISPGSVVIRRQRPTNRQFLDNRPPQKSEVQVTLNMPSLTAATTRPIASFVKSGATGRPSMQGARISVTSRLPRGTLAR